MDSNTGKFDDIRPVDDSEVGTIIQELLSDKGFQNAMKYINPGMPWEQFCAVMSRFKTKFEFQATIIAPVVSGMANNSSSGFNASEWEKIEKDTPYTFISNHRDIVLDAGLLNVMRYYKGMNTTEIAIGDNLFVYPWIEKLVRLNKSFVVRRGVTIRQMLEVSKHLSEYIHYTITEKNDSLWIAQREGRAKDSDDRTQESVLKMLALAPAKVSVQESLAELNILPLAISYEYDPCDYLKAQEFQLKRDNPEYKKTKADDLKNMETGLLGFKGKIHFRFGNPIRKEIEKIGADVEKQQVLQHIASLIDKEIHSNYEIFAVNYIAHDLLYKSDRFKTHYTLDDKGKFVRYVDNQINKIDIANKDYEFLHMKILEMYSNILKNYLIARGEVF